MLEVLAAQRSTRLGPAGRRRSPGGQQVLHHLHAGSGEALKDHLYLSCEVKRLTWEQLEEEPISVVDDATPLAASQSCS